MLSIQKCTLNCIVNLEKTIASNFLSYNDCLYKIIPQTRNREGKPLFFHLDASVTYLEPSKALGG